MTQEYYSQIAVFALEFPLIKKSLHHKSWRDLYMSYLLISRAITIRRISEVPSPISSSRASRK